MIKMKFMAIILVVFMLFSGVASARTIIRDPDIEKIKADWANYNFGPLETDTIRHYKILKEWNGYMFALSAGKGDTTETDNFDSMFLHIFSLTGSGGPEEYASWTLREMGMTDEAGALSYRMAHGLYIDDQYIVISASVGSGTFVSIFENSVGQPGGKTAPAPIRNEDNRTYTQIIDMNTHVDWWETKLEITRIGDNLIAVPNFLNHYGTQHRPGVLNISNIGALDEYHSCTTLNYNTWIGTLLSADNGTRQPEGNVIRDMKFVGSDLYVICNYTVTEGSGGNEVRYQYAFVNIIDFSDPVSPRKAGSKFWKLEDWEPGNNNIGLGFSMNVSGDYVYVADNGGDDQRGLHYLYVLNVADRSNPTLISENAAGNPGGIIINYIYEESRRQDNTIGMGKLNIIGDYVVGLSNGGYISWMYVVELSPDKTTAVAVKRHYEPTKKPVMATLLYGNKIYFAAQKPTEQTKLYYLWYIDLDLDSTVGIDLDYICKSIASVGTPVEIKGSVFDGSLLAVQGIKVDVLKNGASKSSTVLTNEIDWGAHDVNYQFGWWEYIYTPLEPGKYKIIFTAVDENDLPFSDTSEAIEFEVPDPNAKEFEIKTAFANVSGTITATFTGTNITQNGISFIPAIAIYNKASGKMLKVKAGNITTVQSNNSNVSCGNINIDGYTNDTEVKVFFLSGMDTLIPREDLAMYP